MRIITYIKSFVAAGVAVFILSGCSSGSTATGLGLSVGGTWVGNLMSGNRVIANFTMSLSQQQADADDPFSAKVLQGNFVSSSSCIGSGTLDGVLNGSSISLGITTPTGTLNLNGTANNSNMNGTWVLGVSDSEGSCDSGGGTWNASR